MFNFNVTRPDSLNKSQLPQISYIPRIIGYVIMGIMMLAVFYPVESFNVVIGLIANCLVWPHVARLHSKLAGETRQSELINQHCDAFFYGLWSAVVGFQLWIVFALLIVTSLNSLIAGGLKNYAIAILVMLLGMLSGGLWLGFESVDLDGSGVRSPRHCLVPQPVRCRAGRGETKWRSYHS